MVISTHFPPPVMIESTPRLRVRNPHIVLQLGHVLFDGSLFRERPRQHEFGLEHRPGLRHNPVEGRTHPADHGMADSALDIPECLSGIALEPVPIQWFGRDTELDDEVFGEVLGFDFAPLFTPEPQQDGFILAHKMRASEPPRIERLSWGISIPLIQKSIPLEL